MSSEALERAEEIRKALSHQGAGVDLAPGEYVKGCPGCRAEEALDALLAEVARLEQKCAMWEALAEKGKEWTIAAEADLAAARAREQRLREALHEIANAVPATSAPWSQERARVALAAEPAATLAEGEHASS